MNIGLETIVMGVLIPIVGFFLKALHTDVAKMKDEVKNMQVHLPTHYVQKIELKDLFERIYAELVEIKQELRNKEDK